MTIEALLIERAALVARLRDVDATLAELGVLARDRAPLVSRASVSYEVRFTAEHQPPGHLRHHNEFRLVVVVAGPIVGGIVVPFEALEAAIANLLRCIECAPPTETLPESSSVEQVAVWIWDQLSLGPPGLAEVRLSDGPFTVTYRGGA